MGFGWVLTFTIKKPSFYSAFNLTLFSYLAWALLSGSMDCLAASNQTCHQVYDSIADPGEFWVTELIPTIIAFIGVQLSRDKQ